MSDPTNAVQEAIYDALAALSPSIDVYDHVPADASFPFVSIDAQEVVQDDYVGERMDIRFVYLSVWSEQTGKKEVQSLLAQMDTALHRQKLSLPGSARIVVIEVIRKRVDLDADGLTFMGKMTLQLRTTH